MADGVVIVVSAVYGLLVGSFLTVVVDRVPRGASIVAPGSACGACGLRLGPRDLVPVFSWLALRGRCRKCRTGIGIEPVLLELAVGALFAGLAVKFGWSWELPAFAVLAAGLVALTAIDLRTRRLPREITYTTLAIGAPLLVVAALVADEPDRLLEAALGGALALAGMGGLYIVSRGGLGDGDVRLSPLLGTYLGWLGLSHVALGLFLGFAYGAIVGIAAMAFGRAGRKTAIPFGPFLAAGAMTSVYAGRQLIDLVWSG